ncbi:MAG: amidase [Acidimicrobiia bacterium]|nr:amidase [Acidimicrobiia bacterium]
MESLTGPALLAPTVEALRSEMLPADAYLDGVCSRIDAIEPTVHALLPEDNRRERLGEEMAAAADGPLTGVPVGIKDVFHVTDMETLAGSRLDAVFLAGPQGTVVNRLRDAGALVLGKTVTCEFAFAEPGPTANPHDPTRTPGGSSSGSAAAVAAGYTPLAIGTQTIDSTLTPATYCGIVGFKPTRGRVELDGVIPFSPAMDQLGLFTQDIAGAVLASSVVLDEWRSVEPVNSPTLAVPVGRYLQRVEEPSREPFDIQLHDLSAAGATIARIPALDDFEELYRTHYNLIAYQFAQVHQRWYDAFGFRYGEAAKGLYRKGAALDQTAFQRGLESAAQLRADLEGALESTGADAWVSPATTGPAPRGLGSIGDPAMGLPWTHARLPTISIPAGTVSGMPVGVQLAGPEAADEELLAVAQWVEIALSTA